MNPETAAPQVRALQAQATTLYNDIAADGRLMLSSELGGAETAQKLRTMDQKLDELVIACNFSCRALLEQEAFQQELVLLAQRMNSLTGAVRDYAKRTTIAAPPPPSEKDELGCFYYCCCFCLCPTEPAEAPEPAPDVHPDVLTVCDSLDSKLKSLRTNFSLSMDLTGGARPGGATSVSVTEVGDTQRANVRQ